MTNIPRRRALWLAALSLVLVAFAGGAAADYDEGIEYLPIRPPVPTSTPGKVEVVELFWYGCPHCFNFEPKWRKWIAGKPDYVEVVHVPAVLRPSWLPHAKAYYAARLLGVLDKSHQALFDAIHVERRRLNDGQTLARFFTRFGVSEKEFLEAYDSFEVDLQVRKAMDLVRRYRADGVPALVVNGKWRITGSSAGGHEEMLKVLDELVKKEAAALKRR